MKKEEGLNIGARRDSGGCEPGRERLLSGRIINPCDDPPRQFLVERMCPYAPKRAAETLKRLGIHVVWVTSAEVGGPHGCPAKTWRVTEEDRIKAQIALRQDRTGALVCEHMGTLVE